MASRLAAFSEGSVLLCRLSVPKTPVAMIDRVFGSMALRLQAIVNILVVGLVPIVSVRSNIASSSLSDLENSTS